MDWAVEGRSWLSLIFNILLVILVVVSSNLVEGGESAKLEVITREGERSSPHSEQSVHYSTFLQNFATQSIVVHSIHLYPPLWQHQCNPVPNSDLWIPRIPASPLIPPDRWSEPMIVVPVIVKRIVKIWTWKRIVENLPLVRSLKFKYYLWFQTSLFKSPWSPVDPLTSWGGDISDQFTGKAAMVASGKGKSVCTRPRERWKQLNPKLSPIP